MPRRKKESQPHEEIKKIKRPPLVKGMKDILPADGKYWDFVEAEVLRLIRDCSYNRIVTPALEKYELFNHTLFKSSGALEKEVFAFVDRGEKIALRPEGMASLARAFVEHNMMNQPLPLKTYFWGPMFRQNFDEVKLRQFTQVGFAIFGENSPAIDAELIITAYHLMKNLGLEAEVRLNSLGCATCRFEYQKALLGFLKSKRQLVCADCRKKLGREVMRFLSCQSPKCIKLKEEAPQIIDFLDDECRNHLFRVLEYLDELKIPYKLDPTLTRTFDYHNRTVFEISAVGEGAPAEVVASGGRFDNLIEMLSGPATPAAGFAFGMEKIINQLKIRKVEVPSFASPDVYVAQIGELSRQKAFAFFERLRGEKFSVKANFSKAGLKAQLDTAKKLGAKIVLILGQKEVMEETVIIREMDSGNQEVIHFNRVIVEVKKRLKEIEKLQGV